MRRQHDSDSVIDVALSRMMVRASTTIAIALINANASAKLSKP